MNPVYGLIDLHLHLDGSLSVASVRELAAMQNLPLPGDEWELLRQLQVDENCADLNEYLEKFSFPCSLLQTREAIARSVFNLQEELAAEGLLYAEIRFAPQLHTLKGLTQEEVVQAAIEGLEQSDFQAGLILCCMRGDQNQAENLETVRVARNYLGRGVCAVDLAGAEALFPTASFEALFRAAKEMEIPVTIHAGEADVPESVRKAISFGAKRIGHGVRSAEDPELMEYLAQAEIPLELCPTSNLNTNIFQSIAEYPILRLMDSGVKVTVNTDNRTVSHVTLQSEWEKLIGAFSLTKGQILALEQNAIDASFAPQQVKQWLYSEMQKRFR